MDSFSADFSEYCPKCQRHYNPRTPHVCFPEDISVEAERRKLERWLGEYEVIE
jgi:ribosomal protein L44E